MDRQVNPNRPGIREQFVYWMFDAEGNCLYVGMTRQPERRWRRHRYEKPNMVARVAYKRMAGPFFLETARRLEREQQDDLEPVFDVRIRDMRSSAAARERGRAQYLKLKNAELAERAAKRRSV
jgi:predicted GIY-YIG superfamily endonuclease